MQISKPQLTELNELLEDCIQYYCDTNRVSGELVWVVVECFAKTKQAEIKGLLNT